jgi:phospholipase C
MRRKVFIFFGPLLIISILLGGSFSSAASSVGTPRTTTTHIKHLVVIFQENVSFDHYFATYPYALNGVNGSKFVADQRTTSVNGLSAALLADNPNSANPFRLDSSQQRTCDITHSYAGEQKQYNGGLMDKFVQFSYPFFSFNPKEHGKCNPNQVMGYYDGNTVTALWNYAQHLA